jgi:hypothetical protein
MQATNLSCIALHNGVAHANLTITTNHYLTVAPHRQNCCSTILFHVNYFLFGLTHEMGPAVEITIP